MIRNISPFFTLQPILIPYQRMNFIDQIVTHIVRPTRELYRLGKLGPKSFIVKSKVNSSIITINRQDLTLINPLSQKIQVSHYTISENRETPYPTVIYLHGNNGSRNEGVPYIRNILEAEIEVVLLDFAGSGLSEGDYVTLGSNEADDVQAVVQYLKVRSKEVFLWGRSMGAVAALIYVVRNPGMVKAVVIDSPFSSLRNLIKQLASSKTGLPEFFFQAVLPFVDKELQAKAGVSMEGLELTKLVGGVRDCAAMFITSEKDQMVKAHHTQAIFKAYQGPKSIEYIRQAHHEVRNKQTVDKIIQFFKKNSSLQQTVTQHTPSRQNYFSRQRTEKAEEQSDKNARQKSSSKINPVLLQNVAERVTPTMAYYQPPEKVSMAYLNKLKPQQKELYFYRQDNKSIEKGSTLRSYSSQYRISGSSQTSRIGGQSRSVVKYLTTEDSFSSVKTPRSLMRR